ncbi:MAG: DtxR family transcriptional regulator [Candidatus Binatia bacterium]
MTCAANTTLALELSSSLEDYLETIYLLAQQHGFARVKDIARARDVKAASVSIALRKLAELGLVRYERREYIALAPAGEQAGRRIFTRHRLLTRFFEEVLRMPADAASEQACAMEHSLTDEAMDRLVRFFEFLGTCPYIIETFGKCPMAMEATRTPGDRIPADACATCSKKQTEVKPMRLADLRLGQTAVVTHINARGALRRRLLDMGILPDTAVGLERSGVGGEPLWVRCQGDRLTLRRSEANSILVRAGALSTYRSDVFRDVVQ